MNKDIKSLSAELKEEADNLTKEDRKSISSQKTEQPKNGQESKKESEKKSNNHSIFEMRKRRKEVFDNEVNAIVQQITDCLDDYLELNAGNDIFEGIMTFMFELGEDLTFPYLKLSLLIEKKLYNELYKEAQKQEESLKSYNMTSDTYEFMRVDRESLHGLILKESDAKKKHPFNTSVLDLQFVPYQLREITFMKYSYQIPLAVSEKVKNNINLKLMQEAYSRLKFQYPLINCAGYAIFYNIVY